MNNENLVKAGIIFGGGFLLFLLVKRSMSAVASDVASSPSSSNTKQFNSQPINTGDAEIVATAYTDALRAGEPPSKLTELNKECMKDFGMRCYLGKEGQVIVSDLKGNTILTK